MQESWFGYGEMLNQRIKLNEIMLPLDRFLTYDNGPSGQSSILAPVFYSSSGVLMEIPTLDRIGINQPPTGYPRYTWSFGDEKGPFEHRPFDDDGSGDGEITAVVHPGEIRIQVSNSLSQTVKSYLTALPHPESFPPERLFELPTWTTWARYKTDVSQSVVLQFADEIQSHEYPYGVMEIDDRWQTRYGDIEFDPTRFPDPHRMIEELHTRGFKVTCWVIPFLDPESKAGMDGAQLDYLIKDQSGNSYQVPWWQGRGYLLDVSNPEALDWFKTRLIQLQNEIGLDGYKFDAGEACFLPADAVSREVMPGNEYTQRYIDFIGKNFSLTEVRSGWNNQNAPIFFRQWDKWSTWGADNGLKSVLTGILALGIVGYPFVLPDMVGGNSYDQVPDSELMIRWAELNALLPAMQFSLAPWDFGEECSRICKKYAQLHKTFASEFISLAREAASTGLPIIRPIWWNIPEDENALNCKDEFLLGEKYLVAPILKRGARARTVYLPAGDWEDFWTRERLQGERYSEVDAALDQLPVFCKIK
jgi:myogenesis-regulating glycosidase